MESNAVQPLRVAGLFAGIGGFELGMQRAACRAVVFSEIQQEAQAVLKARFPGVKIVGDVRELSALPSCDVVTAGFPCQDLSQCGRARGISGSNSSLVHEVFRLLRTVVGPSPVVVLENVPFMLKLDRGKALRLIGSEFSRLGYRWAYRTIDVRAFGFPQRRLRVVLVASQSIDPCSVLFADDATESRTPATASSFGFYWTEGNAGLGWAVDCVPTIKGGSGLGIPCPPAVWVPDRQGIFTIDIRDAERLQGFPFDWTRPAIETGAREGARWKLVGNAICPRVARWIGRRIQKPGKVVCRVSKPDSEGTTLPDAGYGDGGNVVPVTASTWPVVHSLKPLLKFLRYPLCPLSARATAGFLSRARRSKLRFADGFLDDVGRHLAGVS